jgi:hypothetical protein
MTRDKSMRARPSCIHSERTDSCERSSSAIKENVFHGCDTHGVITNTFKLQSSARSLQIRQRKIHPGFDVCGSQPHVLLISAFWTSSQTLERLSGDGDLAAAGWQLDSFRKADDHRHWISPFRDWLKNWKRPLASEDNCRQPRLPWPQRVPRRCRCKLYREQQKIQVHSSCRRSAPCRENLRTRLNVQRSTR